MKLLKPRKRVYEAQETNEIFNSLSVEIQQRLFYTGLKSLHFDSLRKTKAEIELDSSDTP